MGGWVGGWLETDNRAISVQLNLNGTATGTELGKSYYDFGKPCKRVTKILIIDSSCVQSKWKENT